MTKEYKQFESYNPKLIQWLYNESTTVWVEPLLRIKAAPHELERQLYKCDLCMHASPITEDPQTEQKIIKQK